MTLRPPTGTDFVKATSSFDLPLIRTLGKAFYWQRLIDTGEVANASELARNLKLEVGWVCEVLRMTRLSPAIIRAILEGRQTLGLIDRGGPLRNETQTRSIRVPAARTAQSQ